MVVWSVLTDIDQAQMNFLDKKLPKILIELQKNYINKLDVGSLD